MCAMQMPTFFVRFASSSCGGRAGTAAHTLVTHFELAPRQALHQRMPQQPWARLLPGTRWPVTGSRAMAVSAQHLYKLRLGLLRRVRLAVELALPKERLQPRSVQVAVTGAFPLPSDNRDQLTCSPRRGPLSLSLL